MRYVLALSLILTPMANAVAQDAASFRPFSPISGPNDSIPSPICDLVNFGFCPQPPPPAPPFPDPRADAVPPPPPVLQRRATRHHGVRRRASVQQDG